MSASEGGHEVAAVIPCFRVAKQILDVLAGIGPEVSRIYVVDDDCPEHTARVVESKCDDPRVRILVHESRQGVGGASASIVASQSSEQPRKPCSRMSGVVTRAPWQWLLRSRDAKRGCLRGSRRPR